jgi:hypothetical protein
MLLRYDSSAIQTRMCSQTRVSRWEEWYIVQVTNEETDSRFGDMLR